MPRGNTAVPNAIKRAARALARDEGIRYTAALRRLTAEPVPPIPAEAIVSATADPAAGYAADDWSWDAQQARRAAENLAYWEERRAGRAVRLWEAEIEVRCAAVNAREAHWRLAVYLHQPCFAADQAAFTIAINDDEINDVARIPDSYVARVPDNEVDEAERARLVASYPRRSMPWPSTETKYGPEKTFDIAHYAAALRLGATRAQVEDLTGLADPAPLAPDVRVGIWRAVSSALFLAGPHIASARARAAELAATVVDAAGRPLGRVLDVRPEDGFRDTQTGTWVHPACDGTNGDLEALWDDHDAASLPAHSLPRILTAAADRLESQWRLETEIAEADARHARLHPQVSRVPDLRIREEPRGHPDTTRHKRSQTGTSS